MLILMDDGVTVVNVSLAGQFVLAENNVEFAIGNQKFTVANGEACDKIRKWVKLELHRSDGLLNTYAD